MKSTEVNLRSQPLQATLQDKIAQFERFNEVKANVTQKEKEIDAFIDKSHSLLQKSNVQRVKPMMSQLTLRYHNLHSQCKDIINRWLEIVDNHKKYEDKVEEMTSWLKPLEDLLDTLQKGDLTNDAEAINSKLQILLTEKEHGEHKVNSLTLIGEQLFPDTEAKGREAVRNTLRDIRERWDSLEEGTCCQNIFFLSFY